MNNYSNIPEEYLVKHGYNNNATNSNSTSANNKNINNKHYGRLIKKVEKKGQVDIKKEMEDRYKKEIEKIKKITKDNQYTKEQTAAVFEKLTHSFQEKVKKCNDAVKNIKGFLDRVDFEELELIDALKLGSSYGFENPDPEILSESLVKKNDFDKVIDRVMYIVFRKSKKELEEIINIWIEESGDNPEEWAKKWPDEIKYWQLWVKLAQQMLSRKVNLESYKAYDSIHNLKMNEYDFTYFNKPQKISDNLFGSSQSSNRRSDQRDGSQRDGSDHKKHSVRGKQRDKRRGKREQRGGEKCETRQRNEYMQLKILNDNNKLPKNRKNRFKQLRKICDPKGNKSGKNGKNGKSAQSMKPNEMELFRILANGVEDKGGYINRSDSNQNHGIKGDSIWNKICGKMRKVIYKKIISHLESVDNIKKQSIINVEVDGIDVWPFIFYKGNLNNVLTKDLKNDSVTLNTTGDSNSIKNRLIVKTELKNYSDKLDEEQIKNNIATYLFETFQNKNKKDIKTITNKPLVYKFKNPFTGEIYSNDKLKQLGGDVADKYIEFFNLFSINFIKDIYKSDKGDKNNKTNTKDISSEKGYNKIKNNIFVGLLEYYHNASLVLKNIIKQLCYEYSISEKKICNSKGNGKDGEKESENNKNGKSKKGNKKVRVKRAKSLLNNNNGNGNRNGNRNGNGNGNGVTKEQINNAKIVVSINDQIKEMVKKAQNAENYDQLNKITELLEEHEDKLKEMDYANAVKLLNNIRK